MVFVRVDVHVRQKNVSKVLDIPNGKNVSNHDFAAQ